MASDTHHHGEPDEFTDRVLDRALAVLVRSPVYHAGLAETAQRLARRPGTVAPLDGGVRLSFEYFPPSTEAGTERLDGCARQLDRLGPDYVSVTYGAGGTSRERTFAAVERLQQTTGAPVAGHLTTVNATRAETLAVIDRYLSMGVRHIVALRGDPVADADVAPEAGFGTAAELVAAVRARALDHTDDPVVISVAAYPETHPKAASPEADVANLKAKLDAGADTAITQFFYDNDCFVDFVARCRQAGIGAPIVAGIMPITSFTRVAGFARRCGAGIPSWMDDLYCGLDDAPDVHQLVSATLAAEQCRRLADSGVRHFHFYTMNRPELTLAACRILGLGEASAGGGVRQAS